LWFCFRTYTDVFSWRACYSWLGTQIIVPCCQKYTPTLKEETLAFSRIFGKIANVWSREKLQKQLFAKVFSREKCQKWSFAKVFSREKCRKRSFAKKFRVFFFYSRRSFKAQSTDWLFGDFAHWVIGFYIKHYIQYIIHKKVTKNSITEIPSYNSGFSVALFLCHFFICFLFVFLLREKVV